MVFEIQAFLYLQFLQKIRKFKMAAIFGDTKFFLKNVLVNLQRYPAGQKFHRNRSIAHGFRDTGIFVFSLFGKLIMINKSLITWPFLNQSMPKSNDFQISIE